MEAVGESARAERLKSNHTCRTCLAQDVRLCSIFVTQEQNKATPLALQIMACVGIEVYKDDGMPGMICENCRILVNCCYQFKQMCSNADSKLKTFASAGSWPTKLPIPKELMVLLPQLKPSPTKPQSESMKNPIELETKSKIIKLSPLDLKNIKQGQKLNLVARGSGTVTPLARQAPVVPLMTSTPILKQRVPKENVVVRNAVPEPYQSEEQEQMDTGNTQKASPVILNKLVHSAIPKVEEKFVATGEGTVEMVVSYEPTVKQTDTVYPCGECNRTFPLKQLLNIHQLYHTRERKHPCDQCSKRFFSKYDLAKHYATHTGERPFVCVICRAAFSRSTLLTRHQALHKDEPKHVCKFCDRTFLSVDEFNKHVENHEKYRPFKCASCPKQFSYKQGLERHEVVHQGVLPFQCEYCELSFNTAGKLSRHLSTHAGERPYPCRLCTKSFLLSHHLSRHLRSHNATNQSEYKCCDCNELFGSMDELITHSTQHAMQNFVCPLCREQFVDLETVTNHIKMHSMLTQYACDYCDLLYTSEVKLNEHCLQHHLNELAYDRSEDQHAQLTLEQNEDGEEDELCKPSDGMMEHEQLEEQEIINDNLFLQDDETTLVPDPLQETDTYEITEIEMRPEKTPAQPSSKPLPISTKTSPPKKQSQQPTAQPGADDKTLRQQRMQEFYKRNQEAANKKAAQRHVSDVLKNLPSGVTIKRPSDMMTDVIKQEPEEEKGTIVTGNGNIVTVEKMKPSQTNAAVSASSGPPAVTVQKRGPGRPPKIAKANTEINITTNRTKKEDFKAISTRHPSITIKTEKSTEGERTFKRSASAIIVTKSRSSTMVGQENSKATSDAKPTLKPAGEPSWMIKRTYTAKATASVVGNKRPAVLDLPDAEEAAPSKRPALGRKTLNPSLLHTTTSTSSSGSSSNPSSKLADTKDKVNVATLKRISTVDAPKRTPMELKVGGKTIKVHKMSKEEVTTAMRRSSQIKGKN